MEAPYLICEDKVQTPYLISENKVRDVFLEANELLHLS